MATTPVAYGASNKYNDLIITMDRMAAETPVLFPQFCQVMSTKTKQIRLNSRNPLAFASAFSGSEPSAEQVKMSNHTTTVAESLYAGDAQVTWRDAELDPDEIARAMQDVVGTAMRHYDSLAAAALEAALAGTLTVPDGNGSTVGLFAASSGHTKQGGGGQTNKVTTALSPSALAAAEAIILGWTDNIGKPLGMAGVNLTLVVPPALKALAKAITGGGVIDIYGKAIGHSSDAVIQAGVNPNAGITVLVNPYLTDANDWYLMPVAEKSPLVAWFEPPQFQIWDSSDRTRSTYIGATYNAKVFAIAPTYTTAVGASVT